jgi:hypothetical protein
MSKRLQPDPQSAAPHGMVGDIAAQSKRAGCDTGILRSTPKCDEQLLVVRKCHRHAASKIRMDKQFARTAAQ